MAYLMTDVAAGSSAALQLQQNMGAAPLAVETGKAQAEQVIANAERTKLANLVAETGFKASEDSKLKLRALAQSPEFKSADDAGKLRLSAAMQMETGDIENGAKTLAAAEIFDAKKIAADQKRLDVQAQEIGNAYGVISAVSDDKVDEFVNRLPAESKKALIDKIGESNWNNMSGAEKKEATKNLMLNAKGQMAKQLKDIEVSKQEAINASRERIARIREDGAIARKLMGGDARDMRDWNIYNRAQENIEKSGQKTLEALNKSVDAAQTKLDKTWIFSSVETSEFEKAVKARDDFKRSQIQKELNLAATAPDFPGKSIVVDNLKKELELFPEPEEKPKAKTEPKPAAKADTATKPSATSNKYTVDNPAKPTTQKEYDQLPPGSYYLRDGQTYKKGK